MAYAAEKREAEKKRLEDVIKNCEDIKEHYKRKLAEVSIRIDDSREAIKALDKVDLTAVWRGVPCEFHIDKATKHPENYSIRFGHDYKWGLCVKDIGNIARELANLGFNPMAKPNAKRQERKQTFGITFEYTGKYIKIGDWRFNARSIQDLADMARSLGWNVV